MSCKFCLVIVLSVLYVGEAARILSFLQMPSKSHNLVFGPLLEELLRRGHEIVILTVNPIYESELTPKNLKEISIREVSYSIARQHVITSWTKKTDPVKNSKEFYLSNAKTFLIQAQTPQMQELLNNKSQKFDLLFLDATSRISVALSHVFKAPVILIGAIGALDRLNNILGVPTHPILYPQCPRYRLYDLTMWEKIKELYTEYLLYKVHKETEEYDNQILKSIFGPKTPSIAELQKNVHMLFYGDLPIWEDNRPIPPSVIYIGGITKIPKHQLPQHINEYLDGSVRDVIYVNFGNNINTSDLRVETVQILSNVFSNLPYNVCLKWDSNEFPGKSQNIKTFKWLPQADLLRHPKVKLFITHAGLRSTEEAIEAGVPLIGIPFFLDQYFNSEKYVRHGIGIKLDKDTLTEEKLTAAINSIIGNKSYEENVIKLRNIINDQPMTPLDRAVWWTEHVLRHGGARHLRAAAANMGWAEYYELELVLTVLSCLFSLAIMIIICIYLSIKFMLKRKRPKRKIL